MFNQSCYALALRHGQHFLSACMVASIVTFSGCGGTEQNSSAIRIDTDKLQQMQRVRAPFDQGYPIKPQAQDGSVDASFTPDFLQVNEGPGADFHPSYVFSRGFHKGYFVSGNVVYNATSAATFALTQDGKIDTGFANKGKLPHACTSMAVQSNNKILCAYDTVPNPTLGLESKFAVARYMPDGTLDASFGTGGKVEGHFKDGAQTSRVRGMALLNDGSILIAGFSGEAGGTADYRPRPRTAGVAHFNHIGGYMKTLGGTGRTVITEYLVELWEDFPIGSGTFHEATYDWTWADFIAPSSADSFLMGGGFGVSKGTSSNGIEFTFHTLGSYAQEINLATGKMVKPSARLGGKGILKMVDSGNELSDLFGNDSYRYNDSSVIDHNGTFHHFGARDYAYVLADGKGEMYSPSALGTSIKVDDSVGNAVQPDGKVLIVNGLPYTAAPFAPNPLYRFNTDGAEDAGFTAALQPLGAPTDFAYRGVLAEPGHLAVLRLGRNNAVASRTPQMLRLSNLSMCENTPVEGLPAMLSTDNTDQITNQPGGGFIAMSTSVSYTVHGLTQPAPVWIFGGEFAVIRGRYSETPAMHFSHMPTMVKNGDEIRVRKVEYYNATATTHSRATLVIGCGGARRTAVH